MIWSMLVQCKGVEDHAASKEKVALSRFGHLELIVRSDNEFAMSAFRDVVIRRLKERFGVRAVAQVPPNSEAAWLAKGQITSRSAKGSDGLNAIQRAFQLASHSPTNHACRVERKYLLFGSEQEKGSDHRQHLGRYLLGHQRRFQVVHRSNTCWL